METTTTLKRYFRRAHAIGGYSKFFGTLVQIRLQDSALLI